jgi:uroporphyrinogen decarboxylase
VDIFREFFRPALQRLYTTAKNYDVKVMQHSCGSIAPLIPDFIDMGADIINPIQVKADGMVIDELVANYKGKVTFYGGIDTQELLPKGPAEEIQEVCLRTVNLFDSDGGYILSGSQGLLHDIPYDHTLAMIDTVTVQSSV